MSVSKLIILCVLLVLSHLVFSDSSEIQSVPTGQWKSVKIQENGKNIPFLEVNLLKSATKGVYKVAADFYANSSVEAFGPVTVRVDIYRNYGRKNQVHKTTTVRLGDAKDNLDLAEVRGR